MGTPPPVEESFVAGVRGLAWLLAEALSIGLAAGLVALGPEQAPFVTGNVLPAAARSLLLAVALCFGAAALLVGGLAWSAGGRPRSGRVAATGASPARRRRLSHSPRLAGLEGRTSSSSCSPRRSWWAFAGWARGAVGAAPRRCAAAPGEGGPRGRGPPPLTGLAHPALLVGLAALGYASTSAITRSSSTGMVTPTASTWGSRTTCSGTSSMGGRCSSAPRSWARWARSSATTPSSSHMPSPRSTRSTRPGDVARDPGGLVGAAALPLFLWGRAHRGAGRRPRAVCYLLYPPLHGANLYDFHYMAVAPFLPLADAVGSRRAAIASPAPEPCVPLLREDVAASLAVLVCTCSSRAAGPWRGPRGGGERRVLRGIKFLVMPAAQPDPAFLYAWAGLLPQGETSFSGC